MAHGIGVARPSAETRLLDERLAWLIGAALELHADWPAHWWLDGFAAQRYDVLDPQTLEARGFAYVGAE